MFIRFLDKGGKVSLEYDCTEVEINIMDRDGKAVSVNLDYDEAQRLALTIETLLLAMRN